MTLPAGVTSIDEIALERCSPDIVLYCPDSAYKKIAILLTDNLRGHLYPEFCRSKFYDLLKITPRLNALYQHLEMCGMPDVLMWVIAQYVGNKLLEKKYQEALLKYAAMPIPPSESEDKEKALNVLNAYKANIDEHVVNPFIRREFIQAFEKFLVLNQSVSSKGPATDKANQAAAILNRYQLFGSSKLVVRPTSQAVVSASSSTATATSAFAASSRPHGGAGSKRKTPSSTTENDDSTARATAPMPFKP